MTDTIHVLGEGGVVFEMALPLDRHIESRLTRGHLRRVNADGSDYSEAPATRPALNAPKGEWIGWAVRHGAKPDDAEALTKADLIEQYGQPTPEQADEAPAVEAEVPSTE